MEDQKQKVDVLLSKERETLPLHDFIEMCQEAIRNAEGVFIARSALEKMTLKEFSEMATLNRIFPFYDKTKEYYSMSKEYKNQVEESL